MFVVSFDKDILDLFEAQFPSCRFTARGAVEFHNVDTLFVTVYLLCSEGFPERNNMISHQIRLLTKHANFPYFVSAILANISYPDFAESGRGTKDGCSKSQS